MTQLTAMGLLNMAAMVPATLGNAILCLCAVQSGVEDTKGNNGEVGRMTITNLRVIWVSEKSRRTSISIGYSCISNISVKSASSRLKGEKAHTRAISTSSKYF